MVAGIDSASLHSLAPISHVIVTDPGIIYVQGIKKVGILPFYLLGRLKFSYHAQSGVPLRFNWPESWYISILKYFTFRLCIKIVEGES